MCSCGRRDRLVPASVSSSQLLRLVGEQNARHPRGSRDAHNDRYPNPDADTRPGCHSGSDTSTTSAASCMQGSGAEQPVGV